jgi:uroporphyrin-III C-methyltransferase/precorrin-2 dehydrogenase/sirohydrochlorin ferrochelatase
MEFLPAFLDVKDKQCLLVGGGEVALRKARLLLRAGARLMVVAEKIDDELQQLLDSGKHATRIGRFKLDDLQGAVLAIAATDSEEVNQEVSRYARSHNIPVNVVDQPALCTMIFPAVVDRSPLVVAISSSGSSPVLARKLKEQLEVQLPGATGQLAMLLREYRQTAKEKIASFDVRVRFWESVLDSDCPELVYSGQIEKARIRIQALLEESSIKLPQGEVYLVGAGPGDPDLLTLKALRLMQKADVVLYDRLVSPAILEKVRPDAERFYVGKERSTHQVPQDRINELLIEHALKGKRVLRLKGGDPFIFARGGEEIESLIDHDIPFLIVPGITAALGCASYAGIPLTHREHAHSVQFLTGHFKTADDEPEWQRLTGEGQTLVFYMGLMNLETICARLIEHGLSPGKPAALIQKGTTSEQLIVAADLESLPSRVEQAGVSAPTLLIVGDVVKLGERLSWFKSQNADES